MESKTTIYYVDILKALGLYFSLVNRPEYNNPYRPIILKKLTSHGV